MSFYTTLKLYRPTKPPLVTGANLAYFVRDLAACNVLDRGKPYLKAKFGAGIDQDEKPTMWDEPINEMISQCREIEWDLFLEADSVKDLADQLEPHDQPIYRCYVELGGATDAIIDAMFRESCPDNEQPLTLNGWHIEMEPVQVAGLGSEQEFHVGWLSICLSGYGFLFPWTFADLFQRVERQPDLQRLKALCRRTWPVPPTPLEPRHFQGRKLMAETWPYPIDEPLDWYWGISESG